MSLEVAKPENKSIPPKLLSFASPPHKRFFAGCSTSFVRLAQQLTAFRAWCKQCLFGRRKPDVVRPGMAGMRESLLIRLRACTPSPLLSAPRDALQALQDGPLQQTHNRDKSVQRTKRTPPQLTTHLHDLSERVFFGRFYHHLGCGSTLQLGETPNNWNDIVSERRRLVRRHAFQ